jgi:hypothetical protein
MVKWLGKEGKETVSPDGFLIAPSSIMEINYIVERPDSKGLSTFSQCTEFE